MEEFLVIILINYLLHFTLSPEKSNIDTSLTVACGLIHYAVMWWVDLA